LIIWEVEGWRIREIDFDIDLYLKVDGSNPMTGDLHMGDGTHKILNVANGVQPGDAVNISQLGTKQDNLGVGNVGQFLSTVDIGSGPEIQWADIPQVEGNYLPLDGSDTMTGTLKVGNGTSGNQIDLRSTDTSGFARFNLLKSDGNHYGQINVDFTNDILTIAKYDQADSTNLDSGIILTNNGNVRLGVSVDPSHNEDIVTKRFLDNSLTTKENHLGSPTNDDYILSSKIDGTRSWIQAPNSIPHMEPGQYITGNMGDATTPDNRNIFGIGDTDKTLYVGPTDANNTLPIIARGNWDFQTDIFTNNGDTIWTSGNDGSGSGLDADSVDGIQG
jgi:hypothetical protein